MYTRVLCSPVTMVPSLSLCVAIALLCVVQGKVTDRRGPLNLSFSKMAVFVEELCSKQGGMCVEEEECPQGKILKRGQCPEQQKRGVECCHGLPLSVRECRRLGGECMKECPGDFQLNRADDCPAGSYCCRLE